MRALIVAALAALVVAAAHGATSLDFGDAPDGTPAGYAARPDVQGRFPARAASGGPRHGSLGPLLGAGRTAEPGSRQPDRDADDGAMLTPHSCKLSTLDLIVDGRRLPPGATSIYVNAWFDWNQDGDWSDGAAGSCGPEWAVQNVQLDPARLGPDRIASVPIRFRAGKLLKQVWWRIQVQAESPAAHEGGAGPAYRGGETEDFLYRASKSAEPPERSPRLRCTPALSVLNHAQETVVAQQYDLDVLGVAPTDPVFLKRWRGTVLGPAEGVRVFEGLGGGLRWRLGNRWFAHGLHEHRRVPPIQSLTVQFGVDATVRGRHYGLSAVCRLLIAHVTLLPPRVARQPRSGPVGGGPASGGEKCVLTRSFTVDAARVPANGFWNPGLTVYFRKDTKVTDVALTDTATGKRPPPDFFGPHVSWEEQRKPRPVPADPDRTVEDFFVTLADANPSGPPSGPRGRWAYRIEYTVPAGKPGCAVTVTSTG